MSRSGRERVGRTGPHRHLHQVHAPGEMGEDRGHSPGPGGGRPGEDARVDQRRQRPGRRTRRVDDMGNRELTGRVDREQPGGVQDRGLHREAAEPVGVHVGSGLGGLYARCPPISPAPAAAGRAAGCAGRCARADGGHRCAGPSAAPSGCGGRARRGCPSRRTRRGARVDHGRLGGQLGEVAVEDLTGPGDQLVALGAGLLAGAVARTADPVARVGQGPVELLAHPGLGEVHGAAVGRGGPCQVLEHAPDLVVEPLVHRPAGPRPRRPAAGPVRARREVRLAGAAAGRRAAGAGARS
ncbi:hypothetical protein SFUMM280S_09053 [Streptomyces fumanus]